MDRSLEAMPDQHPRTRYRWIGVAFLLSIVAIWAFTRASIDPARSDREFDGGSRVERVELSELQTGNVVLLGKVWGFAKYHHPGVTGGRLHWDYELFRILPRVIAASSRENATRQITEWLRSLGDLTPCPDCARFSEDLHLEPDADWIRDEERLGAPLSELLVLIHENRPVGRRQHYISHTRFIGNPTFRREEPYAGMDSPDPGFRLLALFRMWNIVEYWFPYRYMIGEPWDVVLDEFVPRLMAAEGAEEYRLEMMALVARINDSHANLWSEESLRPPAGPGLIPVRLAFVDDEPVVVRLAHPTRFPDTGLRRGDALMKIDGMPVDSLARTWMPYYGASNDGALWRDIASNLTRGPLGRVTVTVRRGEDTVPLTTERFPSSQVRFGERRIPRRDAEALTVLSDGVAYMNLSMVRRRHVRRHIRALEGVHTLIIDTRHGLNDVLVFELGGRFVTEPTEFAGITRGAASHPGAFVWSEPELLSPRGAAFMGRLIVLVDERTQSSAEYIVMALKAAPNSVVIGQPTAGANGNVSEVPLPGGITAWMSGIGVYFPDRSPLQRVGIRPDLLVRPTIEGIRSGRDEILEAARRCAANEALGCGNVH